MRVCYMQISRLIFKQETRLGSFGVTKKWTPRRLGLQVTK